MVRVVGLDNHCFFAKSSRTKLDEPIQKQMVKFAEEATINAAHFAHDFSQLFAATADQRDRDIYRVSKLLGHALLQVTEDYLRGLGEVD
jgi:site-specific recombinase XerC